MGIIRESNTEDKNVSRLCDWVVLGHQSLRGYRVGRVLAGNGSMSVPGGDHQEGFESIPWGCSLKCYCGKGPGKYR